VTPTWITRLVLSEGVEESEERSKEEISHRKARHRPRFALRGCAGTSPTSALLVVVREHVACTSGRSACTHARRVSGVLHESAQHQRRRFIAAISLIKAMVSAAIFGV